MRRPGLTSAIAYDAPKAAVAWLERAFGFEVALLVEDDQGRLAHCEMTYGESTVMIGSPWSDRIASPGMVGGKTTQTVHIQIVGDVDAHCARARAAGAQIFAEPENQFYGDRTYRCYDLEGHIWTVGAAVETVSFAEMEARSGHKISAPST